MKRAKKISLGIFLLACMTLAAGCGPQQAMALNDTEVVPERPITTEIEDRGEEGVISPTSTSVIIETKTFDQDVSESDEKSTTPTNLPDSWKDYPPIPNVSERALEIYFSGIEAGNDPHVFSKIGDCQNITTYFLAAFEDPELYSLGDEYAYLQETIDWYFGSYSRESLAVDGGLNVARVLSPFHADVEVCEPNEHPLACEVRINNPSIALISLEENWSLREPEEYETYMRRILDYLIEEGVLPILATKADNLEGDDSINETIVRLAEEYELPIWNFWAAAQPLPHHGLQNDGFHLTMAGPFFDDDTHLNTGWAMRNLTALQTIDAIHQAIIEAEEN